MGHLPRLTLPSLGLLFLAACDQDPLNLACHDVGKTGYALCQWEDAKTYYLESTNQPQKDGGGVLEGSVQKIAWNDRVIVASRYAVFRGDGDGWMVIDLDMHKISGPITDYAEATQFPNLKPQDVTEAWKGLH